MITLAEFLADCSGHGLEVTNLKELIEHMSETMNLSIQYGRVGNVGEIENRTFPDFNNPCRVRNDSNS